jgi:DNA replication and repair protein RecF
MRLRDLELEEFRSFRKLRIPIDPAGFRAIGPNASGKSTILEAIAMLSTTRSPRTSAEREIAHWESGTALSVPPYARLRGQFERADGPHQIEIGITLQDSGNALLKKFVKLDDRSVRAVDVVGQFKTVLFSPEDVDLISGPPGVRRRYLDVAVSQASRPYLRSLSRYGRVLEQRNSLLRTLARDRALQGSSRAANELPFWDSELTAAAVEVLTFRLGAVAVLSAQSRYHFERLTGDDTLTVKYSSSRVQLPERSASLEDWSLHSQPFRQMLSASFEQCLGSIGAEELRRGLTIVGPHRDDIVVSANGADLGRYGSRGQQRLAVVAIKLAELDLLENAAGEPPVLLLDDVLSELDAVHRSKIVVAIASRNAQICVTATERSDLGSKELTHLPVILTGVGTNECLMRSD